MFALTSIDGPAIFKIEEVFDPQTKSPCCESSGIAGAPSANMHVPAKTPSYGEMALFFNSVNGCLNTNRDVVGCSSQAPITTYPHRSGHWGMPGKRVNVRFSVRDDVGVSYPPQLESGSCGLVKTAGGVNLPQHWGHLCGRFSWTASVHNPVPPEATSTITELYGQPTVLERMLQRLASLYLSCDYRECRGYHGQRWFAITTPPSTVVLNGVTDWVSVMNSARAGHPSAAVALEESKDDERSVVMLLAVLMAEKLEWQLAECAPDGWWPPICGAGTQTILGVRAQHLPLHLPQSLTTASIMRAATLLFGLYGISSTVIKDKIEDLETILSTDIDNGMGALATLSALEVRLPQSNISSMALMPMFGRGTSLVVANVSPNENAQRKYRSAVKATKLAQLARVYMRIQVGRSHRMGVTDVNSVTLIHWMSGAGSSGGNWWAALKTLATSFGWEVDMGQLSLITFCDPRQAMEDWIAYNPQPALAYSGCILEGSQLHALMHPPQFDVADAYVAKEAGTHGEVAMFLAAMNIGCNVFVTHTVGGLDTRSYPVDVRPNQDEFMIGSCAGPLGTEVASLSVRAAPEAGFYLKPGSKFSRLVWTMIPERPAEEHQRFMPSGCPPGGFGAPGGPYGPPGGNDPHSGGPWNPAAGDGRGSFRDPSPPFFRAPNSSASGVAGGAARSQGARPGGLSGVGRQAEEGAAHAAYGVPSSDEGSQGYTMNMPRLGRQLPTGAGGLPPPMERRAVPGMSGGGVYEAFGGLSMAGADATPVVPPIGRHMLSGIPLDPGHPDHLPGNWMVDYGENTYEQQEVELIPAPAVEYAGATHAPEAVVPTAVVRGIGGEVSFMGNGAASAGANGRNTYRQASYTVMQSSAYERLRIVCNGDAGTAIYEGLLNTPTVAVAGAFIQQLLGRLTVPEVENIVCLLAEEAVEGWNGQHEHYSPANRGRIFWDPNVLTNWAYEGMPAPSAPAPTAAEEVIVTGVPETRGIVYGSAASSARADPAPVATHNDAGLDRPAAAVVADHAAVSANARAQEHAAAMAGQQLQAQSEEIRVLKERILEMVSGGVLQQVGVPVSGLVTGRQPDENNPVTPVHTATSLPAPSAPRTDVVSTWAGIQGVGFNGMPAHAFVEPTSTLARAQAEWPAAGDVALTTPVSESLPVLYHSVAMHKTMQSGVAAISGSGNQPIDIARFMTTAKRSVRAPRAWRVSESVVDHELFHQLEDILECNLDIKAWSGAFDENTPVDTGQSSWATNDLLSLISGSKKEGVWPVARLVARRLVNVPMTKTILKAITADGLHAGAVADPELVEQKCRILIRAGCIRGDWIPDDDLMREARLCMAAAIAHWCKTGNERWLTDRAVPLAMVRMGWVRRTSEQKSGASVAARLGTHDFYGKDPDEEEAVLRTYWEVCAANPGRPPWMVNVGSVWKDYGGPQQRAYHPTVPLRRELEFGLPILAEGPGGRIWAGGCQLVGDPSVSRGCRITILRDGVAPTGEVLWRSGGVPEGTLLVCPDRSLLFEIGASVLTAQLLSGIAVAEEQDFLLVAVAPAETPLEQQSHANLTNYARTGGLQVSLEVEGGAPILLEQARLAKLPGGVGPPSVAWAAMPGAVEEQDDVATTTEEREETENTAREEEPLAPVRSVEEVRKLKADASAECAQGVAVEEQPTPLPAVACATEEAEMETMRAAASVEELEEEAGEEARSEEKHPTEVKQEVPTPKSQEEESMASGHEREADSEGHAENSAAEPTEKMTTDPETDGSTLVGTDEAGSAGPPSPRGTESLEDSTTSDSTLQDTGEGCCSGT